MLSADAQHREIGASLNALRELTGRSVDSFAYPYGGATDYSSATVRILRESGLALACTTSPRSVVPRTDPFQIPRILVRNWNTSELQRRLEPFIPR
jgi:peptidoglycan/xylan/chitin deacetylase (PgdA/CDA1 family)